MKFHTNISFLKKCLGVGFQQYLRGMALAGLIIGIPLFYKAGFIVVVPLIFAIAATTRLLLLYVGVPMLKALLVAHGFTSAPFSYSHRRTVAYKSLSNVKQFKNN
jgi:hypothetical protein